MVPRGRSQLGESFVWLVPLVRIDRLDSFLLTQWIMVHGRSSLMESLVWLIPFLCVKKGEKKKREDERANYFPKNVSRPSNPPDELAQNVSKKSPSDELFLHFLRKFSIIYMIRIRFFGPGELIQRYFRAAR